MDTNRRNHALWWTYHLGTKHDEVSQALELAKINGMCYDSHAYQD